jgi:hypothetical protein
MTIEPIIVEPISTIRTNTTTQSLVNNKITVAPTTSPSSTTSNTTTTSTSTSSNSSFAIKPQRSNKKFFNLIFAVDPVQIESSGP